MVFALSTVNQALQQEDIEGLIASGAPQDEYALEAERIVAALNKLNAEDVTENSVIAVIAVIWAQAYHRSDEEIKARLPSFRVVAQKILPEK